MKPLRIPSELAYVAGLLIMSLAVAMTAAADFGVSMIVAPAYILSLKWPVLSFGQAEYLVQGVLFAVFCVLMKRVKPLYFLSFGSGLLYGLMLDGWRRILAPLNPAVTEPGSMAMPLRLAYLLGGTVMTSLAVALLFRVYLYPQVYDFFVKGIAEHYALNRTTFKQGFDAGALILSVVMSLVLFGGLRGIGWGTLLMTVCNGVLIGLIGKAMDRFLVVKPLFPRLEKAFAVD